MRTPRWFSTIPLPARHVVGGALLAGVLGGVVGLIVGLIAYPPTAWFAIVELGLPAGVVGGALGFISGLVRARTSHASTATFGPARDIQRTAELDSAEVPTR